MSTQPKPKLKIYAKYLGPILSLDAELTKNDQNLIFARNGTGKSFLSRAFRYLDSEKQNKDISDAAHHLISDESSDGTGEFSFSRGIDVMGALQLAKQGANVSASTNDTIFHVFSEDFVHDELRERSYEIDGTIENQISVDSENIKQKDAQEALEKAIVNERTATSALYEEYDNAKVSVLHEKAGINKQLREYKSLSLDALLEHFDTKPNPPAQPFTEILKDLDSLKAIPAEPVYPDILNSIGNGDFDLAALESSLQQITSPSSVSEEIKKDIDAHHSFYETGVKIIQDGDNSLICPLCKQGITSSDPKAVIDAYIAYFEDEEERHKSNLREFFRRLTQKETELNDIEKRLTKQRSQYDALKHFVPSKRDTELDEGETNLSNTRVVIASLKAAIEKKADTLHLPHGLPGDSLASHIANINKVIEDNNAKVSELNKAVGKSGEERKALQRKSCEVFTNEFAISNWANIDALIEFRRDAKNKQAELAELEKSSPSTDARVRVADTFELLLKEFFANKYNFDKETFVLKRGEHEMLRGTHRTLSDGEKTAIAFCYFQCPTILYSL